MFNSYLYDELYDQDEEERREHERDVMADLKIKELKENRVREEWDD